LRPEGPEVNRHGRQAVDQVGLKIRRPEGPAVNRHFQMYCSSYGEISNADNRRQGSI
jgi:hypothetical protein